MKNLGYSVCRNSTDGRYQALEIFTICLTVISMIAIVIITSHSIKQIPKQKKMENTFKILYGISIISASICIITTMTATISCVNGCKFCGDISMSLAIPTYFILILALLATFISRLHYTFNDSVYKLSIKNQRIFITLYTFCALSATISMILYVYILFSNGEYESVWTTTSHPLMPITMYFCFICLILYVSTSIWAAKIFVSNLIKVTNLSANSLSDIMKHKDGYIQSKQHINDDEDDEDVFNLTDIQLNEHQTKLIDSISKYVSLFSVAIVSSIFTVLVMSSGEWMYWGNIFIQILFIFLNTDCIINIGSMYLQYNFANKYYQRYTRYIERIWKPIFIKKAKGDMIRAYKTKKKNCIDTNGFKQTDDNEASSDTNTCT